MIQSRSFGSIVVPKDKTQVVSKPSSSSSTSPSTTYSDSAKRKLILAVKEAERLMSQSLSKKKQKSDDTTLETISSVEAEIRNAFMAADALLDASRPSKILIDAMCSHTKDVQFASLHQAYITLTTQCLNCIDFITNDDPLRHNKIRNLIDKALELGRTAHELSLPFHQPLYKRLIDVVAAAYYPSRHRSRKILEISSWVSSNSLNLIVDANLFRSAILTLIQNYEFQYASDLIIGMQSQHEIMSFDMKTLTAILLQLRDSMREILEGNGANRRKIPDKAICDIVAMLDKSVVALSTEQKMKFDKEAANYDGNNMTEILKTLNQDDIDILESIMAEDSDSDSDEDEFSTDEEQEADAVEAYTNPLDLAINSILIKAVTDKMAQQILTDLMKKSSRTIRNPTIPDTIHVIIVEPKDTSEKTSDDSGDDWSGDDDDDFLDMRDHYDLPDITAQVEKLNGGQKLRFSKQFKEILWMREYEDDEYNFYADEDDSKNNDNDDS